MGWYWLKRRVLGLCLLLKCMPLPGSIKGSLSNLFGHAGVEVHSKDHVNKGEGVVVYSRV